jgi:hypothetical protein
MNRRDIEKVLNRYWQDGDNLENEIIHIDDKKDLINDLFALYVVVPKGTLCECGGKERVALDCTMKPCKHPLSFMKNYKTNTNTNR